MSLVILGAGRVGMSVPESLCMERNDITVVDIDGARLMSRCRTAWTCAPWHGNAAHPSVLRKAGTDHADMRIVRVRCADFQEHSLNGWAKARSRSTTCPSPRRRSPTAWPSRSTSPRCCRCWGSPAGA